MNRTATAHNQMLDMADRGMQRYVKTMERSFMGLACAAIAHLMGLPASREPDTNPASLY